MAHTPAHLALSRALSIPVLLWETGELTQQAPEVVTSRTLAHRHLAIGRKRRGAAADRARHPPGLRHLHHQCARRTRWRTGRTSLSRPRPGPERTASTKTYTAGLAALHLIVAHLTGRKLRALRQTCRRCRPDRGRSDLARLPAAAEAAARPPRPHRAAHRDRPRRQLRLRRHGRAPDRGGGETPL